MRRLILAVAAVVLIALAPQSPLAGAQVDGPASPGRDARNAIHTYTRLASDKAGLDETDLAQLGPNPFLSLTADRDPTEVVLWRALAASLYGGGAGRELEVQSSSTVRYRELETVGVEGENDRIGSGEPIGGFGTGRGERDHARIAGSLVGVPSAPPPAVAGASVENDGSIPLANAVSLSPGELARFTGAVGDGPTASTGDFDFYALGEVSVGQTIVIDTDSSRLAEGTAAPDTYVALYGSSGELIDLNDDFGGSLDARLEVVAPRTDAYFAMVTGCCGLPLDPFDPTSGEHSPMSGLYEVDLGVGIAPIPEGDGDVYLVDLAAGDVVAVAVVGPATDVEIYDRRANLAMGSSQNVSFSYPRSSPLRHGGDIGLEHVAPSSGRYAIRVIGGIGGRYEIDLSVLRPGGSDRRDSDRQIFFLDFDGAVVDTRPLGGSDPRARLSPLASFLRRWDLERQDEDAVIDATIASFRENIDRDLAARGRNGDRDITGRGGQFDVVIRNSRDHPDPGRDPNVTRLILGGSVRESGLDTIGIAESIDPGNSDRSEVAVILLDFLSARTNSLNTIPIVRGTSKIELVGRTVGSVAAHEAGHLLGNWHTQTFNARVEIMDAGGDLPRLVGVGPDERFGTRDDDDVDFAPDQFFAAEGFWGREDPVNRTAFALSSGWIEVPSTCTITGTQGADELRGTPYNDVICGLGGDDVIDGRGGRDRVVGGPGNDNLAGAGNEDVLVGEAGDDRLLGGGSGDVLDGGEGLDRLIGGPGRDTCQGEARVSCERP